MDKMMQINSFLETYIELNLEHMSWNFKKVRDKVKIPVMAVLMVGKLNDAIQLREAGVTCPIHNFGSFYDADAKLLLENNISQSICGERVNDLARIAQRLKKQAEIHIHIDTGMGRLGIPFYDALLHIDNISRIKSIRIAGISTTLTEDYEFDKIQLNRLREICRQAEKRSIQLGIKHAASSAALIGLPSSYLDMVRPGIVLYGYYPSYKTQKKDSLRLKPVLQFKSHVVAVKSLQPGDSVSYHRGYVARKKEKIAIIPVGYSNGYPCNIQGEESVLIRGRRFPVTREITANHLMVSLKSDSSICVGDEVVLIGRQKNECITAHDLAQWANVSVYKILLGINPLIPKRIVKNKKVNTEHLEMD
jgi:alanine racemase